MKKLELNQMENLEGGGMNQRNCGITGLVIVGGLFFGPVGWGISAAAVLTAASGDCF
jgi:hypothetical protein